MKKTLNDNRHRILCDGKPQNSLQIFLFTFIGIHGKTEDRLTKRPGKKVRGNLRVETVQRDYL